MRNPSLLSVLAIVAACDVPSGALDPGAARSSARAFDCEASDQRLTCDAPSDPGKQYVCHAGESGYNKISVSASSSHTPGVAHGGSAIPDQSPGASADDVGSGSGLDCDCTPRVCYGTCTGADDGEACEDADPCTTDGTCDGDDCAPGGPTCAAGTDVDECNVQTGECDGTTGECFTEPRAAGTACEGDGVCTSTGACVPHVVIDEIESSGGVPGDWVELLNLGTAAVDVSGWVFKDNTLTGPGYTLPAGTSIPADGRLVLDEATFGFGLGSGDSARLYDADGTLVDSYTWTTHAVTTYGRCPDGTGGFTTTTRVTKGTANDCSVAVVINEVESSGGTPGDWVELYNPSAVSFDLSGWSFKDNDNSHNYALPAGTTLSGGSYLVLDEATFGFGLGSADSARLYDASAALFASYSWTSHAATTYGRCPNGTGEITATAASTKGSANSCGGAVPTDAQAWPGGNAVTTVDQGGFGGNLSDLFYEAGTTDVLWAARNGPSTLYRLLWDGASWTPDPADGWGSGKTLRYPDGTGAPDAEGVTRASLSSTSIYVATERDNDASTVSRKSVLRYDASASGTELIAAQEWNLNADLPTTGANLGLEAITWIPDSWLVAHGFLDESTGTAYNPASYADHGDGLFFVGLEANGTVYAYALDHTTSGYHRVSTITTVDPVVHGITFDRDVGYLWTQCGSGCNNELGVMKLASTGKFATIAEYARPSTMANVANEGITVVPESLCSGGFKAMYWSDDGETGGHAIRRDTVPCGAFVP